MGLAAFLAWLMTFFLAVTGVLGGISKDKSSSKKVDHHQPDSPSVVSTTQTSTKPTQVPTPALLPGLVVFVGNVLRQRNISR